MNPVRFSTYRFCFLVTYSAHFSQPFGSSCDRLALIVLTEETEGQTVVVSHDRSFLDAVTDETIIFRNKKLAYHPGNYNDWEKNTEEQRKRKTRLKEMRFSSFRWSLCSG